MQTAKKVSDQVETAQDTYKPAQRQLCWTILILLLLLPFFISINTGIQTLMYSTTCVLLGCLYAIEFGKTGERVNQFEEKLDWTDTLSFPIYASIALVTLYFLYSVLPKELLNNLFRLNFCVLGFTLMYPFIEMKVPYLFPAIPNTKFGNFKKTILQTDIDVELSTHSFMAMGIAGLLVVLYFLTGHWSLNNILAMSFTIGGIKLMRVPNFKYALSLLWLLFFYDIYWVFKTDVMITVAKSFDAPIKLSFPQNTDFKKFSLLGLGDMVIPGICIAVILKFELDMLTVAYTNSKKDAPTLTMREINSWPTPMFHMTMFFYLLSIIATLVGMNLMKTAQPALLYIVPGISLAFLSAAYIFKCHKEMIAYEDDHVGKEPEAVTESGKQNKEKENTENKD